MTTYAETIGELLAGQMVEIHTGDTKHNHNYSDYSLIKKSVLRGRVISGKNDVLIIDCITETGGVTRAYLNGFSITVITRLDAENICAIYFDESSKLKND